MIEDRSILLQLWPGFALPTPQQNRKARVQCNPAGKPLKFRGALSKQAEPALGTSSKDGLFDELKRRWPNAF